MSEILQDLQPSDVLIRPSEAASRIGFSISAFWHRHKSDPDFPHLIYDQKTGMAYVIERHVHTYRLKRLSEKRPGRTGMKPGPERAQHAREAKARKRLAA